MSDDVYGRVAAALDAELRATSEPMEAAFVKGYMAGFEQALGLPGPYVPVLRANAAEAGRRTFRNCNWLHEWLREHSR